MSDWNERFVSARRKIINEAWPDLNPQQKKAVLMRNKTITRTRILPLVHQIVPIDQLVFFFFF